MAIDLVSRGMIDLKPLLTHKYTVFVFILPRAEDDRSQKGFRSLMLRWLSLPPKIAKGLMEN